MSKPYDQFEDEDPNENQRQHTDSKGELTYPYHKEKEHQNLPPKNDDKRELSGIRPPPPKEEEKRVLAPNEQLHYFYDSFDTFLFYSFFIVKKWYLFGLLAIDGSQFQGKNSAEFFQKSKEFIWSKEDNWFKKAVTIIILIPVVLILAVYAILISVILLVIGIICLIVFVIFVDLPFIIVLAIQMTLLLLLVFFTAPASCAAMSEIFLTSGIWYVELIWMILFVGLMLFEYNDIGNSIVFVTVFYKNKKIGSKCLMWFYIIFSCFPQMVQFTVTSYSAWISVRLIFENSTYIDPFSHFAGLFVVLQVDSFIMSFIKISKLFQIPCAVFEQLESWKREERELEKQRKQQSSQFPEAGQIESKTYSWDRIHFTSRFIKKFFGVKEESESQKFHFQTKFEDEMDEKTTTTRLTYVKYMIMALGMAFILYNFIIYVIAVCCDC